MGEGLAQARGAGDERAIAYALQVLGTVALWDDDLPGTGDLFANADERYAALGELNGAVPDRARPTGHGARVPGRAGPGRHAVRGRPRRLHDAR